MGRPPLTSGTEVSVSTGSLYVPSRPLCSFPATPPQRVPSSPPAGPLAASSRGLRGGAPARPRRRTARGGRQNAKRPPARMTPLRLTQRSQRAAGPGHMCHTLSQSPRTDVPSRARLSPPLAVPCLKHQRSLLAHTASLRLKRLVEATLWQPGKPTGSTAASDSWGRLEERGAHPADCASWGGPQASTSARSGAS